MTYKHVVTAFISNFLNEYHHLHCNPIFTYNHLYYLRVHLYTLTSPMFFYYVVFTLYRLRPAADLSIGSADCFYSFIIMDVLPMGPCGKMFGSGLWELLGAFGGFRAVNKRTQGVQRRRRHVDHRLHQISGRSSSRPHWAAPRIDSVVRCRCEK